VATNGSGTPPAAGTRYSRTPMKLSSIVGVSAAPMTNCALSGDQS
jgi:hypothetical protein